MSRVVAFADAQRMLLPAPPSPTTAQSAQLFYKDILFKKSFFPFSHTAQQQNDTQLFFSFYSLIFRWRPSNI
jgi:hypothetical protein